MRIVDPEPWLRRERDEQLQRLERELEAGADRRTIAKEMRDVRRAYWVAVLRSRAPWSMH